MGEESKKRVPSDAAAATTASATRLALGADVERRPRAEPDDGHLQPRATERAVLHYALSPRAAATR